MIQKFFKSFPLLIFIVMLFFKVFLTIVEASPQNITVYYFVAEGCEHCIRVENYINAIKMQYPYVVFQRFDVFNNDTTIELFIALTEGFNITEENREVPAVFLGDTCLIGEEAITQKLESLILEYSSGKYYDKASEIIKHFIEGYRPSLSLPFITTAITAAIASSLNPCTFAAIISLIGYVFQGSSSKRVLLMCGAFIIGILVFYLGAGLILIHAIGILRYFHSPIMLRYLFGSIAIVFSILEFKEFFFYGRGLSLEHPGLLNRIFNKYSQNINIIVGFILGMIISIISFSCTGPIYISVLIYPLLKTGLTLEGFLLLILYNLIIILPLIIILLLVYFGRSVLEIDAWRIEKRRYMRLIAGVLLLMVGIVIITGLI